MFNKMSKATKLFWSVILLLFVVYLALVTLSSLNYKKEEVKPPPTFKNIIKEIEVIVHSERLKENIENNLTKEAIQKSLVKNMALLNKKIDDNIDFAFFLKNGSNS